MTADLAEACGDLETWLPALAYALIRDNTPGTLLRTASGGVPYNPDVMHAILTLRAEVPAARHRACQLAGEPCPPRPLDACLRALPRLHGRLADTGCHHDAAALEDAVWHWTRTVKSALGLRTRDTPLRWNCPLHDEPSPLVVLGSEGFIRDDHTVRWQHSARIWCPQCGESWDALQWPMLGRMLETA